MVTIVLRIKQGSRYPLKTAVWVGKRLQAGQCLVNGVVETHPEGSYYLRYSVDGKKTFEPCDTKEPADAIAFRERREAKLAAKKAGLTVTEDRKPEKPSLPVYDIYLAETKANKAKRTWQAYANTQTMFRASYRGELAEVLRSDILEFKTYLKGQDFSKRSVYNHFLNLMVFLKWAQIQHGIKKGDWPPKPEREPEEYTDAEIQTLLNTAKPEERLVLNCFLCSGLRSGELAHLTYGDIDFDHSVWTVRPKEGWDTKTEGSQRNVPVPEWLTKKIGLRQGSRTNRDLIFFNRAGGPNLHLLRIVKRVAKRAELTDIRVDEHKFRSTAITRWLQDGNTPMDVKEWVGHKDLATILRYYAKVQLRSKDKHAKATATFSKFATVGD